MILINFLTYIFVFFIYLVNSIVTGSIFGQSATFIIIIKFFFCYGQQQHRLGRFNVVAGKGFGTTRIFFDTIIVFFWSTATIKQSFVQPAFHQYDNN